MACSQVPKSFSFCATKHVRPVKETGSTDPRGGLAELVRKSGLKDESQEGLTWWMGPGHWLREEDAVPRANKLAAGRSN